MKPFLQIVEQRRHLGRLVGPQLVPENVNQLAAANFLPFIIGNGRGVIDWNQTGRGSGHSSAGAIESCVRCMKSLWEPNAPPPQNAYQCMDTAFQQRVTEQANAGPGDTPPQSS